MTFDYNSDGIRTKKSVAGDADYYYRLDGSKVVEMAKESENGIERFVFVYDAEGNPHELHYYVGYDDTTPTKYFYVLNLQGDVVFAWNETTDEVELKRVVETYVNETDELIHLYVNGEKISTTPSHPFYSPVKGWTDAVNLRAGDILVLVNGEYVVLEKVQHEILESPIAVYNFQVEDDHTYYVGESGVLVHNSCSVNNGIELTENSRTFLPDEFYTKNAPLTYTPNTSMIHYKYNEYTGNFEKSFVHYDFMGQQNLRIDYTNHGQVIHGDPHVHFRVTTKHTVWTYLLN